MTKPLYRRRPKPDAALAIPDDVAAWFAGTGPEPWAALIPQQEESLRAWWRAWRAKHPGAVPPADAGAWLRLESA